MNVQFLKKNRWIIIIFSLLIIVTSLLIFINRPVDAYLGEVEIIEIVEERFTGQIVQAIKTSRNGHPYYDIEFQSPFGLYYVQLDGISGMIHLLNRLSDNGNITVENLPLETALIGMDEAERIIRESVSEDARIVQMKLEEEGGKQIYILHVEQSDGLGRFEVDALTGNVLLYYLEAPEGEGGSGELIGETKAKEIALSQISGEVDDIDLEEKDGRLVYEVEVENDVTDEEAIVFIDAMTGEVLLVEWD